jgi:tetratricopeptide (TPR) repeat protein
MNMGEVIVKCRKKDIIWYGGLIVCLGVVMVFVAAVRGDYGTLRQRLSQGPMVASMISGRDAIRQKAHAIELTFFEPSFSNLRTMMTQPAEVFEYDKIKQQKNYYRRVIQHFPKIYEAQGIMGFLMYREGKPDEAIPYYEQAVQLNPSFFWFYYDLGVLWFQKGDYQKASEYLMPAIQMDRMMTLKTIYSSRVYRQIVWPAKDYRVYAIDPQLNLNQAIYDSCILLVISYEHLKNYAEMFNVATSAIKYKLDREGIFHYYAGLALFYSKQYAQAIYYFQKCTDQNVSYAQAYHYWGLCLTALGRSDTAQQYAQKYQEWVTQKRGYQVPVNNIYVRLF